MIHDGRHDHEGINGIPWGMKSYPKQFNRFPYYEYLRISHLFDTIHIRKNVVETLRWILDGRSKKEKNVKICIDVQESNHIMKYVIQFHTNGVQVNINSIPSIFTEQQINVVKEVMWKIKFPTGFCVNLKNIITKQGDFYGGQNTWLACLHQGNYYCYVHTYIFFSFYCVYFFSCLYTLCLINGMVCILIQYVLPLSLPDKFNDNVKQVIYHLGKYMR